MSRNPLHRIAPLCIMMLLAASIARAGIALVGSPPSALTATTCGGGSFSFAPITVSAGDALIVEFLCTATAAGPCYNGNNGYYYVSDNNGGAWPGGYFQVVGTPGRLTAIVPALAHPGGSTMVTVTWPASYPGTCSEVAYLQEWSGVGSIGLQPSARGTSVNPSVTFGSLAIGDLLIATAGQEDTAAAISAGPTDSFIEFADPANPAVTVPMAAYKIAASASESPVWTTPNSAAWLARGQAFHAATPAPTPTAVAASGCVDTYPNLGSGMGPRCR